MKNQRGFALVITLLITALLVALTAQFIDEVYVDTSVSHNYVAAQQASILAASGVKGGVKLLKLTQQKQNYSSLLDTWAQPLKFEEEQGKLVVYIEEESGKLNLNCLLTQKTQPTMQDMVSRLLNKLAPSLNLTDALIDWIDQGDDPVSGAGAESTYYKTLKPAYAAKNAPFDTLDELGLVKGFTGKFLVQIRPMVTVYPDSPNSLTAPININTAPPEVIAAVLGDDSKTIIDPILEHRKTTPFKATGEVKNLPGLDRVVTPAVELALTVKGAVYRIHSEALVKDTSRVVEAVVRVTGTSYTVLYWREY